MAKAETGFQDTDYDEHLRLASRFFIAGDLVKARASVEQARKYGPAVPEVWIWKARVSAAEKSWPDLLEAADHLLELEPDNIEAAQFRARALSNLQRWEAATDQWKKIVELLPGNRDALRELAVAAARSSRNEVVLSALEQIDRLGPNDSSMLRAAARLAVDAGALAEAFDRFQRLAERDPAMATQTLTEYLRGEQLIGAALVAGAIGRVSLGSLADAGVLFDALVREAIHLERQSDNIEAYRRYFAASLLLPDNPAAQSRLQRLRELVLEELRQKVEEGEGSAEKDANDLLRANRDFHDARRLLARKYAEDSRSEEALAAWRVILRDFPDDREALTAAARLLQEKAEFGEAERLWQRLASEGGGARAQRALEKLPKAMLASGKQAFAEGRFVEAWNAFSQIPQDSPLYPDARSRMEKLERHALKRMRESYRSGAFDEVLDLYPLAEGRSQTTAELLRFVAKAAGKVRKFDIARDAWTSALVLDPSKSFEAWLGIARAQLALGETRKAKKALELAASQQPDDPNVLKTAEMIKLAEGRGA